MHELNELIVEIIRRTLGNSPDDSGDHPVRNLAREYKNRRNDCSLKIDVRPNQLGELLDLPNQVVQAVSYLVC